MSSRSSDNSDFMQDMFRIIHEHHHDATTFAPKELETWLNVKKTDPSTFLPGYIGELWAMLNSRTVLDRTIQRSIKEHNDELRNLDLKSWLPGMVMDSIYFNRVNLLEFLLAEKYIPDKWFDEIGPFLMITLETAASKGQIGYDLLEVLQPHMRFSSSLLDTFIRANALPEVKFVYQQNPDPKRVTASHSRIAYEAGNLEMMQWVISLNDTIPKKLFTGFLDAICEAKDNDLSNDKTWTGKMRCLEWLAQSKKLKLSPLLQERATRLKEAAELILNAKPQSP